MHVLVTGGTGFVGRAVVHELARRGHKVRVLARHIHTAPARALAEGTGCRLVPGSILDPTSLTSACAGTDAVIHLTGIIRETADQTFARIHAEGTRRVVEACRAVGVLRLLHMSASGTRPHAVSAYHRTKWQGECAVRKSGLLWTIFRPAVIYGPGDGFCRLLALPMIPPLRWLTAGIVPMIGDGSTLVQPVRVDEVAAAFAQALDLPSTALTTFELGGPPIPFRVLLETLAAAHRVRIHPLPVPREFAYAAAALVEILSPWKMPTPDHVAMLEEDQQADSTPARQLLGFQPRPFAQGLDYISPRSAR
jgi:NADH dehydrogenase